MQYTYAKRIPILLFIVFIFFKTNAQDISFDVHEFKGGYNVSCHGLTDGSIDVTIVGGTAPYTYLWSNSATNQDLTGIGAGSYTLTVTDALSHTDTKSVTLFEPDLITTSVAATNYNGFNVSQHGLSDAEITATVAGGAPPYTYVWSDGGDKPAINGRAAGTYSVTVSDQNGCSASQSIAVTEPLALTLSFTTSTYGAYNTNCYDSHDGSINLTVAGGALPYSYAWDNGSFTEDLSNLEAETYEVQVTDANGAIAETSITLTRPDYTVITTTKSSYANGHNTGCFGCSDGSITVSSVSGGTSPFTYSWSGGAIGASVTNIVAGTYTLTATDAHGCTTTNNITLTDPAPNAWGKNGTVGDTTDFFGTTNSAPVIMKTNNSERLRITSDGKIGIGTLSPQAKLEVNGNTNINGNLKATGSITFGGTQAISYLPASGSTPAIYGFGPVGSASAALAPCISGNPTAYYQFHGMMQSYGTTAAGSSNTMSMGFDGANGIIDLAGENLLGGPNSSLMINYYCGKDVYMCTGSSGKIVMATSATGTVSIGETYVPTGFKLAVKGKIMAEDITVKLRSDWPDYVFSKKYLLPDLKNVEKYIQENKHLPEVPSAEQLEKNGGDVSALLKIQMKKIEELTLYVIEQNKRIEQLEKNTNTSK